jgi:hypothetical protein
MAYSVRSTRTTRVPDNWILYFAVMLWLIGFLLQVADWIASAREARTKTTSSLAVSPNNE